MGNLSFAFGVPSLWVNHPSDSSNRVAPVKSEKVPKEEGAENAKTPTIFRNNLHEINKGRANARPLTEKNVSIITRVIQSIKSVFNKLIYGNSTNQKKGPGISNMPATYADLPKKTLERNAIKNIPSQEKNASARAEPPSQKKIVDDILKEFAESDPLLRDNAEKFKANLNAPFTRKYNANDTKITIAISEERRAEILETKNNFEFTSKINDLISEINKSSNSDRKQELRNEIESIKEKQSKVKLSITLGTMLSKLDKQQPDSRQA